MKKINSKILIIFIVVIVVAAVTITIIKLLGNENNLTIREKNYINNMRSNLIDVNVLSTTNVFGKDGFGVFYDFLNSFEEEYDVSFNKIYITDNNNIQGFSLTKSTLLPNNAREFYIDHYVLVSKAYNFVSSNNIIGTVGVLKENIGSINKYLNANEFKTYDNKEELLKGFEAGETTYIAVPRIEYLDIILDGLYSIVYHISDMKEYYYITPGNDEIFNSIINKYYNTWKGQTESFNKALYSLFTNKLKITEKELDVINSKKYTYAFIENAPYDVKRSGTYGGIMASYIKSFENFSGIVFDYKEYKNINDIRKDISKGKVDLYVDYYNLNTLVNIDSLYNVTESVIMSNADARVFTNIVSIAPNTVYIKENSIVRSYLENLGLKVATYKNTKEVNKLLKNNEIVIMDYPEYLIYSRKNDSASERFNFNTSLTYNFKSNNDTMFNRLFTYYTSIMDSKSLTYSGVNNYDVVVTSGKWISQITKYGLIIIAGISVISFIIYKSSKKVYIKNRIKKTDKMKYIDVLTSLKNRNFLTENIPKWNQNTIYPQAIILINLNDIQGLNDTLGYIEGDKQIQSFANILIKTQLDNTEIMRTDGNEFTIYMVGYSEKQVLSYIKKLNKEIKNLPHDRGAAIGFSMIQDDIKLIDDAINEATEIMKKNKELALEELF